MEKVVSRIEELLKKGTQVFMNLSDEQLEVKPSPEKWSKKEILGHLVDSAIHNLVRFTEAQYSAQPYKHRTYDQNELVLINDYQHKESEDLLVLWLAINRQIVSIISSASERILRIPIQFTDGTTADMRFLMTDYADHLEHHLRQLDRNHMTR
ncbi:MAG: DinB family protein [Flavobacterium sp.]|uniref:DinB family protein n=1 Tax=Flavobacterium sp. TaxID=239 RepID=UPI00120DC668|nr:DinB family protein [Flavobacterium sp.]RZJ67310.1 MAG: DinB family protein [Flavobacterium sp.]